MRLRHSVHVNLRLRPALSVRHEPDHRTRSLATNLAFLFPDDGRLYRVRYTLPPSLFLLLLTTSHSLSLSLAIYTLHVSTPAPTHYSITSRPKANLSVAARQQFIRAAFYFVLTNAFLFIAGTVTRNSYLYRYYMFFFLVEKKSLYKGCMRRGRHDSRGR